MKAVVAKLRELSRGRNSARVGRCKSTILRRHQLEQLEARIVLDAQLMVTEIVASNSEGIEDDDGDRSDWIEIYNAGDTAANLDGWRLTDNAAQNDKWLFPAVTLGPESYVTVFASGKDRRDPDAALHTNFRLSADGEYLGLSSPDGSTTFAFSPQYPPLLADTSYGIAQDRLTTVLVSETSNATALVPTADNGGEALGATWTAVEFKEDATWTAGAGPIGLDGLEGGYSELIGLDLEAAMFEVNSTAYIRIPFTFSGGIATFAMTLRMKYDDGYVAYLNGVEVARRNAPEPLTATSRATARPSDAQSLTFEDVDISNSLGRLRLGENVLAIHGMNASPSSNDFLIGAELHVESPLAIENSQPRFFANPTPGRANGLASYAGLTAPVAASAGRGFYDQPIDVQLTSTTPGSTLVYTTNGSLPTVDNGIQVATLNPAVGPTTVVQIRETTTLRVLALREGFLPSPVMTQTYLMLNDVIRQNEQSTIDAGFPPAWGPRQVEPDYGMDPAVVGPDDQFAGLYADQMIAALKAVPTISIVTDMDHLFGTDRGIYSNSASTGFEWERPASIEIVDANGEFNFQADSGLRIAGDNVRNFANSKKQSFRLEFRERYGPRKLRVPLFGNDAADSFDTIILRGAYNDGWVHSPNTSQYIREAWARETLLAMGRPQAHGRFVHLYLNGVYWGLYNAVERPNAAFSSEYFGGDKDEWDALNTGVVRDGDANAWQSLRSAAGDVRDDDQQVSNAALQVLLGNHPDGTDDDASGKLIDLGNYIDYLIVNHYGGNVDWPGRNYYVGRRRGPESTGFKFYAWDTEKILNHGEGASLTTNQVNANIGVAEMYRSLRANDEFRLMFADQIHRHFFNGGVLAVNPESSAWDPEHPEHNQPAARYAQLAEEVELALIAESARWGDTQSTGVRNDDRVYTVDDWRAVRDSLHEDFFPRRSAIVLQQYVEAGLYPELSAPVFSQHGGDVSVGFALEIKAPGAVYFTVDGTDPRQSGLSPGVDAPGIASTALVYNAPVTIRSTTIVKARTLVDGQWSALNEARFSTGISPLRISEIMYHPVASRDEVERGFEDDDFEYIELVNSSTTESIELEGFAFTAGIDFVFPARVLPPGENVLVVRNAQAFQQRYGHQVNVLGQFGDAAESPRLSNAGETLLLVDATGQRVHDFEYSDAWHPATDGQGRSLTIIERGAPLDSWGLATSWRTSAGIGGSPGVDDSRGDINGDGAINVSDVDLYCALRRDGELATDISGDGQVDERDLIYLVNDILRTTFGDADANGVFDSNDLRAVVLGIELGNGPAVWSAGDWNCDGVADSADLVLAFQAGKFVG